MFLKMAGFMILNNKCKNRIISGKNKKVAVIKKEPF